MSILLAVFINCGSMPIKPGGEPVRVCIASVLHSINAPLATCQLGAAAEANSAELRLIKGGFTNTINSYQCFELNDKAATDPELVKYMRQQYGAVNTNVTRYDFKDGTFVKREQPKASPVPGRRL